ncbi:MAG: UDP-N-acetylmuramoyl-L-alanyl-D-glutamate--2,6-diaminopimelate ligase, partial [Actinomycetota bacterium]|nr:UDP-N-acetylmuramoyl-L-alanyl-D-glutamate--2,6-diaminopimelate ligase [Actinomycetota bacterium]
MSHHSSTSGAGAAGNGPADGGVPVRPRRVVPVLVTRIADAVDAPLLGAADPSGVAVTGLTLSTGSVLPGDLYAALPGAHTHGARFAARAVEAGAAALITDAAGAPDCAATGRPVLVHERPRGVLGELARIVYADPAARVSTIGVTGTQGKTTVTYLLEAGLRPCGEPAAVIGTTGARIDGRPVRSALTTPEAPDLHALFGVMVDHGVTRCAMEVSSHALVLGRVDGLVFDVAVFLNLGRDHLDFHADLDDYFDAKASLFTSARSRQAVIDVDDPYGARLVAATEVAVTTISAHGRDGADWRAVDVQATSAGSRFTLLGPHGQRGSVQVPLPGAFNVANALAAIVALVQAGRPLTEVLAGIATSAVVPGRMEQVDAGQAFRVVVDYAHKPDAVRAVLQALRPTTAGRLTIVL